ncbi:MAG: PAS domain S-box protein [Rhodobacteraceae bacterium]|nr:PAS domain S-box protein [Paracoccaceae bacterium]MCP5355876.1 PAS domain S-box protein [Paracoccaceae bacterium]
MLCRKNDCRAIVAFRNRQAGAGVPEPWVNARPCRWGGCDTPKDAHSDAAAREARQAGPGPEPWVAGSLLPSRRLDLLSLVPLAAIVALVALVAALVWIVDRSDGERAKAKLATDALWVEQTLRFQMSVDEDMLVRLALDAASGVPLEMLKARARLHIAANPEMLAVRWYDAGGALVSAVAEQRPGAAETALVAQVLQAGTATARPVYGQVDNGVAPMAQRLATTEGGVVVASISLPIMLDRHLPWWIAEQYGVQIADTRQTLAARARRPVAEGAPQHRISFDPPLAGSILEITAYDRAPAVGNTALLGAIVALAAFAILALLVVQRNALSRRRAEERLRAEMAFRRAMEESLTVGLRAKDHAGRILYVNAAFCKLVDLPAAELIGRVPPMPYWSPEGLEDTLARQRRLAEGPATPQSFESRFRRADGSDIDVQVYEAPLIDAQGRHQGWMGSVIDITEAKRAARLARAQDESLARTGRLVTLGEMASTLAHELNQPLGAIASYAAGGLNLIDGGRTDPALIRTAFEKMAAQSRRAGLIIRRIQDFVKKREPQMIPLDLADVAAEALGLLAADAREMQVRLVLVPPRAPLPPVMADRILIEQVLVNLIRNGMEAMAGQTNPGADALSVRIVRDGDSLRIEVADRGPGIPAELAERLFDPFTSTKSHGMGMGLNICRSIVELHHGTLGHGPNPGGGTVFAVVLPVAAARPDAPDPEKPAETPLGPAAHPVAHPAAQPVANPVARTGGDR